MTVYMLRNMNELHLDEDEWSAIHEALLREIAACEQNEEEKHAEFLRNIALKIVIALDFS